MKDFIFKEGKGSVPIDTLTKVGIKPVYDIAVDHENHRYYANGISIHNCNTYGLYLFILSQKDDVNPLKNQPFCTALDHKCVDVIRNMYRVGWPIDLEYSYFAALDCISRLNQLEQAIYKFVGREIKFTSPQEVSKLLFDEYHIPVLEGMVRGKPTKSNPEGAYSTKEDILAELEEKYPEYAILRYIVSYRKLKSSLS